MFSHSKAGFVAGLFFLSPFFPKSLAFSTVTHGFRAYIEGYSNFSFCYSPV